MADVAPPFAMVLAPCRSVESARIWAEALCPVLDRVVGEDRWVLVCGVNKNTGSATWNGVVLNCLAHMGSRLAVRDLGNTETVLAELAVVLHDPTVVLTGTAGEGALGTGLRQCLKSAASHPGSMVDDAGLVGVVSWRSLCTWGGFVSPSIVGAKPAHFWARAVGGGTASKHHTVGTGAPRCDVLPSLGSRVMDVGKLHIPPAGPREPLKLPACRPFAVLSVASPRERVFVAVVATDLSLPDPWLMAISERTGRPYFYGSGDSRPQFCVPPGTVVRDQPPAVGAVLVRGDIHAVGQAGSASLPVSKDRVFVSSSTQTDPEPVGFRHGEHGPEVSGVPGVSGAAAQAEASPLPAAAVSHAGSGRARTGKRALRDKWNSISRARSADVDENVEEGEGGGGGGGGGSGGSGGSGDGDGVGGGLDAVEAVAPAEAAEPSRAVASSRALPSTGNPRTRAAAVSKKRAASASEVIEPDAEAAAAAAVAKRKAQHEAHLARRRVREKMRREMKKACDAALARGEQRPDKDSVDVAEGGQGGAAPDAESEAESASEPECELQVEPVRGQRDAGSGDCPRADGGGVVVVVDPGAKVPVRLAEPARPVAPVGGSSHSVARQAATAKVVPDWGDVPLHQDQKRIRTGDGGRRADPGVPQGSLVMAAPTSLAPTVPHAALATKVAPSVGVGRHPSGGGSLAAFVMRPTGL